VNPGNGFIFSLEFKIFVIQLAYFSILQALRYDLVIIFPLIAFYK
jgi:hypothetical protein